MIVDGRRVGRYELRYELSSGGMGTVYLARLEGERGLVRAVALKCLHPHLARSEQRVDMFFDEVRVAARIRHPHVCPVLDFGVADGVPFLAMEYVHGETLASIERAASPLETPLLARRLCALLVDVCEGLHAAHELRDDDGELLGVVHRDVTPRNLFLGYDGLARVVDFGVAHAIGNVHQTESGQLKGTLGYMAPEVLLGEPVDRRADVWALGVVAWQMLTAQKLFRREGDLETLKAITDAPIEAPSRARSGVPRELDAVVMRALERDPSRRWPTARAFGEALQEAALRLGGMPHPAELARWMAELFPGLGADKENLERSTRVARDLGAVSRSWITSPVILAASSGQTEITAPTPEISLSDVHSVDRPAQQPSVPPHPPPARPVIAPAVQAPEAPRGPLFAAAGALRLAAVLHGTSVAIYLRASPVASPVVAAAVPVASPDMVSQPVSAAVSPAPTGLDLSGETEAATDIETATATATETETGTGTGTETGTETGTGTETETVTGTEAHGAAPGRVEQGEPGHVSVSARGGWADLYHRGRHLGRTPTRVSLPAGRQVLDVRPFGRDPRRRILVQVPSGGETTAVIEID